jgi:integrase
LNTGSGSKDIADLRNEELDLDAGTIHRFRSKAGKYTTRRKVLYTLWPCTISLLRKFRCEGELVLRSEGGTTLWRSNRVDLITGQFMRLRKTIPVFRRTFYDLRATGSSAIAGKYGLEMVDLYTAHAARGQSEERYVSSDAMMPSLQEALLWLGKELGVSNLKVRRRTSP